MARKQAGTPAWNQKNLDYEIETFCDVVNKPLSFSWNQKNLDYEIETIWIKTSRIHISRLETKRTSITRLKQGWRWGLRWGSRCLKPKASRLRDWNGTVYHTELCCQFSLETKRTSITRLKPNGWVGSRSQHRLPLKPKEPRLRDWNSKIRLGAIPVVCLKPKEPRLRDWNGIAISWPDATSSFTWNQKNLDYEIETRHREGPRCHGR